MREKCSIYYKDLWSVQGMEAEMVERFLKAICYRSADETGVASEFSGREYLLILEVSWHKGNWAGRKMTMLHVFSLSSIRYRNNFNMVQIHTILVGSSRNFFQSSYILNLKFQFSKTLMFTILLVTSSFQDLWEFFHVEEVAVSSFKLYTWTLENQPHTKLGSLENQPDIKANFKDLCGCFIICYTETLLILQLKDKVTLAETRKSQKVSVFGSDIEFLKEMMNNPSLWKKKWLFSWLLDYSK